MVRPPDLHDATAGPGPRPDRGRHRAARLASGRGNPPERARAAWRALPSERRLAAFAALGLLIALFLPWYQKTVIARGASGNLISLSASLTGWGAFSFVEAAVLLIAGGVLGLLFARAEGAAFHVPGGDGGVITAAGAWACLLIIWRMFDKQGTTGHGLYETSTGIEWGIFIALAVAALLTYAGSRIKLAHEPEPPLPGERPPPGPRAARLAASPAPAVSETDLSQVTSIEEPDRTRTRTRVRPSSLAGPGRRAPRGLDFSELERIEVDEPPEAPRIGRRDRPD